MDYGLKFTPQNYIAELMAIGQNFGGAYQRHRMGNALSGPGSMDEKVQTLLGMGRVDEATKLMAAQGLADYRQGQLGIAAQKAEPSWEEKLIAPYLPGAGSVEPFRLGPDEAEEAEANGVVPPPNPNAGGRPSLENAPSKVQDILGTTQQKAKWKQEGEGEGNRASFDAALSEAAPKVDALIDGLVTQVREADEGTFSHALGPTQGVAPTDDWRGTLTSGLPQTLGSVANYLEKGAAEGFLTGEGLDLRFKEPGELGGGFTDTLRSKVLSTQASLIGVLQRLLRVPGIGAQSDYELRQIIAQAGELSKARTKADFQDRLQNVLTNMKAQGIPISIPSLDQVTGQGGGKFADRLEPEANTPSVTGPTPRKVQTSVVRPDGTVEPPAASMVGGGADAREVKRAPAIPSTSKRNKFIQWMRTHPDDKAAAAYWDSQYGEGNADFLINGAR
jgi:hypothetical protein